MCCMYLRTCIPGLRSDTYFQVFGVFLETYITGKALLVSCRNQIVVFYCIDTFEYLLARCAASFWVD